MSTTTVKYVAFDLYGTLLDTSSVANKLSENIPSSISADKLSSEWRKYQLEYTWRLVSMGLYEPFDLLTRKSLIHAATEAGCSLSEDVIETLLMAYDELTVFEDVPDTLEALKALSSVNSLVFSNGTERMVFNSIKNNSHLAHFAKSAPWASSNIQSASTSLPSYVVVGEAKSYKPSRAVYHLLATTLGKVDDPQNVWLVSGNPFDVVGARAYGLNAIWVDRVGRGWTDQLGRPTEVVQELREIVSILSKA